jgi:hypothetical protein
MRTLRASPLNETFSPSIVTARTHVPRCSAIDDGALHEQPPRSAKAFEAVSSA